MQLNSCMYLLLGNKTRRVCTIIATHPDLVARVANNAMTLLQHTLEIICPGTFHSVQFPVQVCIVYII